MIWQWQSIAALLSEIFVSTVKAFESINVMQSIAIEYCSWLRTGRCLIIWPRMIWAYIATGSYMHCALHIIINTLQVNSRACYNVLDRNIHDISYIRWAIQRNEPILAEVKLQVSYRMRDMFWIRVPSDILQNENSNILWHSAIIGT